MPVVALLPQIGDGVLTKEGAADLFFCRLIRDRLRAILAEFRHLPILVRTGPRATLAVEAGLLINLEQCLHAPLETHLLQRKTEGLINPGDPSRHGIALGHLRHIHLRRRLRAGQRILVAGMRILHRFTPRRPLPNICRSLGDGIAFVSLPIPTRFLRWSHTPRG